MSDDSMINTLSISATVAICQCARKWFYDIRGPDFEIDNKITQLSLSLSLDLSSPSTSSEYNQFPSEHAKWQSEIGND